MVSGFTSSPSGLRDQSRSLSSAPCASLANSGSSGKCWAAGAQMGPGSGVPGMEDPGKCSSGATGGKKGAERQGQLEGTANGRGGVNEAKLGRSLRGLPRWQQGPSWQGTGAEPSPREREGERGREKGSESVHRWRCPLLLPTSYFFLLLLETFSPHPGTFLFPFSFASRLIIDVISLGKPPRLPSLGESPRTTLPPPSWSSPPGPVVQNQESFVRLLNICVPSTVGAGTVSVLVWILGSSPAWRVLSAQ